MLPLPCHFQLGNVAGIDVRQLRIPGAGRIATLYDKWHLVPFGEYQPSWAQIGIQLVPGGGFASGPGPVTLRVPGVPPFGPLICYEANFPG